MTPTTRRRRGRPRGASGKSEVAILTAARESFATHGFRGTTMRGVAKKARVDPALVHHFFGTKERLFAAVVQIPPSAHEVTDLLATSEAERASKLVRHHLERIFVDDRELVLALLRASLGDVHAAPMLRRLITTALVDGPAAALGSRKSDDVRLRAELVGAVFVGLFVLREVLKLEPIAAAPVSKLVGELAPMIDVLLQRAQSPRGRR